MNWWELIIDFLYHLFKYKRITATSTLSTKGGTTIAGGSIKLSYAAAGSNTFIADGTGVTDQAGKAVESVYLRSGKYTLRVSFPGSGEGYGPSQNQADVAF